jgi:hypothetical protein
MSAAPRMEEIMSTTRPRLAEPPSVDRPSQEDGPRLKLPEAIQAAAEKKMVAELKPIADKFTRLRATLDAYEVRVREDVERRVSNAILAVLDMQQAEGDDTFESASKDLRDAIAPVAEMVGLPFVFAIKDSPPEPPPPSDEAPCTPPPPTVASITPSEQPGTSEPEAQQPEKMETIEPVADSAPEMVSKEPVPPAPSTTAAPVSRPAPVNRPPRVVTAEHIATGKRLIAEVEALRPQAKEQHSTRLFPLIQAIAAEIRQLQERLPMGHDLNDRLGKTLGALNGIRIEGGVQEFVKGLGFNSHGNWAHLSFQHRKLVAKFDMDAAEAPSSAKTPKPKPQKADEPETNGQHQWPSLPRLRAMTKPILLAGGIRVPEKLKSIQERFGFTVEWHEIDHDNPRASQALLAKVRAGKVGVLVFLEGVMRHGTWKPVSEACHVGGIPYAMADKAGTASLQQAFDELERKLAT